MGRVKSKKYSGVYYNKLADKDRSYSYIYKDLNGKTCRVATGKKSNGITELFTFNKRAETINGLKNGVDPLAHKKKKEQLLFQEIWDYYIKNKALSDKVRVDYKSRWTKHMEAHFSDVATFDGLKAFRDAMGKTKRPLSARSIDMMVAVVGTAIEFWNSAQRRAKVNGEPSKPLYNNPVPLLREEDTQTVTRKEKKKRTVTRERFLSKKEVQLLLEALEDKPELLLFTTLSLSTGGRLGTIMQIRKKHISGNKITLINEKVGDGIYTGFLTPQAKEMVKPLLKVLNDNDMVVQLEQRPLQRRLQRVLNKLFNSALKDDDRTHRVVVHTLRHTFASQLVAKGTPIITVQKLLDHSKIDTTMKYAHLAPDAGADDVAGLWL